jgi:hypothetical protein
MSYRLLKKQVLTLKKESRIYLVLRSSKLETTPFENDLMFPSKKKKKEKKAAFIRPIMYPLHR